MIRIITFSVKKIATMEDLPETLKEGRLYFIGEERCIVARHGNDTVTYGDYLAWSEDDN